MLHGLVILAWWTSPSRCYWKSCIYQPSYASVQKNPTPAQNGRLVWQYWKAL